MSTDSTSAVDLAFTFFAIREKATGLWYRRYSNSSTWRLDKPTTFTKRVDAVLAVRKICHSYRMTAGEMEIVTLCAQVTGAEDAGTIPFKYARDRAGVWRPTKAGREDRKERYGLEEK